MYGGVVPEGVSPPVGECLLPLGKSQFSYRELPGKNYAVNEDSTKSVREPRPRAIIEYIKNDNMVDVI